MSSSSGGVTTRRQKKRSEFEHVLTEVLDQDPDSPLRLALLEFQTQDVPALITLSNEIIDSLSFPTTVGKDEETIQQPLNAGLKSLIRIFQDYVHEQRELLQRNGIEQDVDIMSLDPDDFDSFRINRYATRRLSGMSLHGNSPIASPSSFVDPSSPTRSVASARYGTGPPVTNSGASVFSAGGRQQHVNNIKRDKNHYKELKTEKSWDDWENSTRSTARAHGCGQVLDPSYVPSTDEELVDFVEQQSFMYSVFVDKIQTLNGKRIVNKYKTTFDAQKVFEEVSKHALTSTSAALSSSRMLTFLTSDRLNLDTWKFTTEDYVLAWLEKLRIHESMNPTGVAMPEPTCKVMLQNAVSMVDKLNSVKDDELKELSYGRSPMTFSGYQNLLLSACSTLDEHLSLTRRTKPRHMSPVQVHELQTSHEWQVHSHELSFQDYDLTDDGTDVHLEAYRAAFPGFKQRPAMRGTTWKKLSKEGQTTWDQLSAEDKRLILDESSNRQSRQVSFHDRTVPGEGVPPEDNVGATETLEAMAHDLMISSPSPAPQGSTPKPTPPPGNVNRLLSKKPPAPAKPPAAPRSANVVYMINKRHVAQKASFGSLVDRGANGGIAGDDVRIIAKTDRYIDVSGIDSHEVTDLPIVSVGGVVQSQAGDVLLIFHQYASMGRCKTIHSALQLESFGSQVMDMSSRFNSQGQRLITSESYVLPLDIVHGLAYLPIWPYTDHEWNTLPHVVMTSDVEWDPSIHDQTISDDQRWYDKISDPIPTGPFDLTGNYRFTSNLDTDTTEQLDSQDRVSIRSVYVSTIQEHQVFDRSALAEHHPDAAALRPYFLYQDPGLISRTFKATTRYARTTPMGRPVLHHTYRSPFPACNVHRRNEPVATDTIKASCPSLDGGQRYAQVFVGRHSLVIDVYPLISPKHFVSTLEDVIRSRGAMDTLISDRGSNEISNRVKDILRALSIRDWNSEAHYQHQNHAERRYRDLETTCNLVFNMTGAPSECWLFCLHYVAYILNHTATRSLGWRTPLEKLTGITPDISAITRFRFWEPVYFATHDPSFPSDSTELLGRFLGFAPNVGHALTFQVLNITSGRVLQRSQLRSAVIPGEVNALLPQPPPYPAIEELNDDPVPKLIPFPVPLDPNANTNSDAEDDESHPSMTMDDFDPASLIGRTFLSAPLPDGQRFRSRIAEVINEQETRAAQDPTFIKFRCVRDADDSDEIMAYHEFAMALEEELEDDGIFKFRKNLFPPRTFDEGRP